MPATARYTWYYMNKQEHQQHENWMDKLKPCVINDAIEELTHYSLSQADVMCDQS